MRPRVEEVEERKQLNHFDSRSQLFLPRVLLRLRNEDSAHTWQTNAQFFGCEKAIGNLRYRRLNRSLRRRVGQDRVTVRDDHAFGGLHPSDTNWSGNEQPRAHV